MGPEARVLEGPGKRVVLLPLPQHISTNTAIGIVKDSGLVLSASETTSLYIRIFIQFSMVLAYFTGFNHFYSDFSVVML